LHGQFLLYFFHVTGKGSPVAVVPVPLHENGEMKYKTINLRKEGGLATITLNRPDNLNALNGQAFCELGAVLDEAERDDGVKVVLLTGGEHCFSAGFDLREINELAPLAQARRFLREAHGVFDRIEELEKPVVAAISGFALGGGCELALACDLRIAAENATFGQPEIKIGMIPGGGGTQRLPRLIGLTKAKELLYTGDHINAQEAYRIGLLNRVVASASLMDEAKGMALKIASQPQSALKAAKFAVNGGRNMDMQSAMAYEARCFDLLFSSEDQKEGVMAYMEKRKPVFKNR
jgi:enoyl-CoA hydratase